MKKMIMYLLVLVSLVVIGCVGLDCMTKNYATQLRNETIGVVYDIESVCRIEASAVEREEPFAYGYKVTYRDVYMDDEYECCEIINSVNVIDMFKAYY